ncbi:transposase [Alcaligenes faecalis]|uniref:SPFH domain-containing protein n=1 Tax=Alcaligenes TaxID=507 RepID=UPI000A2E07FD|nr:SPFH domain-containing protein [Alcaligenes faecalis]OSZ41339.1 transposase [Alcaligenes faecalis]OSZ48712.1 transposase [Alcaligenes faecalis]OSZ54195.1 transposase [Alcaligenes faecalis]
MKLYTRIAMAAAVGLLAACSKVPAGHVGVKVHLLGGEKGVDTEELGVGRYWVGWNEDLFLFPTFTQNHTWTDKERLSFQTVEGLAVSADVGISYHVNPAKVTSVFQKYRKGIDEITDIYLRNMVRDALVKRASSLGIESVYGAGKASLIEQVQADVAGQTGDIGITIEKIYWVGELGLPETVVGSINAKIQATQMAAQRQNEVAQARAEAEKAVAAAKGEAEARLTLATAEADAIRIKGDALRQNPGVVSLSAIEKWDGKLPVYSSDTVPFIQIPR